MIGLLGEAADEASVSSLVRRSRAPQGITAAFDDVRSFWRSLARHGAGHHTRPLDGSDAQPLAPLPDAGLPHLGTLRVLSVERRVRVPGSAAGRARAPAGRATPGAQSHPPRGVAPVRRRRRPALVARTGRPGRPHEVLGRQALARLRDAAVHVGDRRHGNSRRERAVPRRPGAQRPTSTKSTIGPASPAMRASLYEHCVRAVALNLATGAHGLPLMGTGDWNDGMNLVGSRRQGRKRLARLVPPVDPAALRRPRGGPRRDATAPTPTAATRRRSRARSSRPGTANGTAARTSTTGRRSDRRRTRSAASTRSRSRGPSLPAAAIRRERGRRWSPPNGISCGVTTGSCCC